MKLTIELIPKSTWKMNCRSLLSSAQWNFLKKQIVSHADNVCQICGDEDTNLDCHEVWGYRYNSRVQYLKDLIAICKLCHLTKHYGRTQAVESKEVFALMTKHILRVNKITMDQFQSYLKDVEEEQNIRTLVNWKVKIDKVNDYLPSYLQYDGRKNKERRTHGTSK